MAVRPGRWLPDDFEPETKTSERKAKVADRSKLPLPEPTPETRHFWDGAKAHELRLQRCKACDNTYFPPRPFCPDCLGSDIEVFAASGKGKVYSYVINHRPHPAFDAPYSIAIVELEEGPHLMTNIVGVEQTPEALELDMAVEVTFEDVSDEISLPHFRPEGSA